MQPTWCIFLRDFLQHNKEWIRNIDWISNLRDLINAQFTQIGNLNIEAFCVYKTLINLWEKFHLSAIKFTRFSLKLTFFKVSSNNTVIFWWQIYHIFYLTKVLHLIHKSVNLFSHCNLQMSNTATSGHNSLLSAYFTAIDFARFPAKCHSPLPALRSESRRFC